MKLLSITLLFQIPACFAIPQYTHDYYGSLFLQYLIRILVCKYFTYLLRNRQLDKLFRDPNPIQLFCIRTRIVEIANSSGHTIQKVQLRTKLHSLETGGTILMLL